MGTNRTEKVVVMGATPDPSRYAYLAANMLTDYGYEMIPVGMKKGEVAGKKILNDTPELQDIHTVTLYVGTRNQDPEFMKYVLSLNPKRVIFNPGTENDEFEDVLQSKGIEPVEACTLVMLRTGQF